MSNKYLDIFNQLWNHAENEIVEFKKAEHSFDIDELGKYFSALSNEANLCERECGWIVFGVWDKRHEIIGTSFKEGEVAVNKLKQDMSQHTTDNLIFRDIVPLEVEGKRVLLFQVPASPRNIVMHWKGASPKNRFLRWKESSLSLSLQHQLKTSTLTKRSNTNIPGLSFSWKRALDITQAKQRYARETGIPSSRF